ncbi:MAG: alanine racemase [Thermodesulfobacteriota bacterium]
MPRVAPSPDNLVTVDLAAIAHNCAVLRGLLPPGLGLAGVVKADAYGHGILPVARTLKEAGAQALAVAQVHEGLLLRRRGIEGPILVMMGLGPGQAQEAAAQGLTPLISAWEDFQALSAAAQELGRPVACQLKVDTGMSRLGVAPERALELLRAAAALPGLELTGLDSHLATGGDPRSAQARRQSRLYAELLAAARAEGYALPLSSLAGSGGVLAPPAGMPAGPGLARVGIALYGGLPHAACQGRAPLKGAMRFRSRLLAVRRVAKGQKVSYGGDWTAPRDTWLGAVAAGYSDGYPRAASNKASVLVQGRPASVRGRVCMNLTVVELSGRDPLPEVGAEVVLLGRQGRAEITADQLGAWAGTISYEITCSLGAANRRRYARP